MAHFLPESAARPGISSPSPWDNGRMVRSFRKSAVPDAAVNPLYPLTSRKFFLKKFTFGVDRKTVQSYNPIINREQETRTAPQTGQKGR